MKRSIHNPYTVNHLLYVCLILLFVITLIIANTLPKTLDGMRTFLSEVMLNLSYGCIASTVVAWLIDCANTRNENIRANKVYDEVYSDLKMSMGWYLDTWARLCKVCFKDKDYSSMQLSWLQWYHITREHYLETEPENQKEMMAFFKDQLLQASKGVISSLDVIRSQSNLLTINHAMDSNMNFIFADLHFEFTALNMVLSRYEKDDLFWEHMDAIAEDLIKYIQNWSDIMHYNTHEFSPYNFFETLPSN